MHTLAREEIEILREELLRDFGWLEDGKIRLNVLCDMALDGLRARIEGITRSASTGAKGK